MSTNDDSVGYKNPPKKSQFKPGSSGNPAGRPKKISTFFSDLDDELNEKIIITERGKKTKITKRKAFTKSMITRAISGDARFIAPVIKLILANQEQKRSVQEANLMKVAEEGDANVDLDKVLDGLGV